MTKKDAETLARETHFMVHRLCQKVDNIEDALERVPSLCENAKTNLATFRRDINVRLKELANLISMSVRGR